MIIVFDLDDTLYEDRTYVLSGFRAVAQFLAPLLILSESWIFSQLEHELTQNRNQVFDRFLHKKGIQNRKLIAQCLSVYRSHPPQIDLFPEAAACINRLNGFPLYVVTDGNQRVQKRKFLALGLNSKIKKCLCTYAYGIKHSKPSPYCFLKICSLEHVSPSQVVYIGDNPQKDFVGIKPLCFHTIRVLTGPYRNVRVESKFDAQHRVENLNEVTVYLLEQLLNKKDIL